MLKPPSCYETCTVIYGKKPFLLTASECAKVFVSAAFIIARERLRDDWTVFKLQERFFNCRLISYALPEFYRRAVCIDTAYAKTIY